MTAGTLFSFTSYLASVYNPLTSLLNNWVSVLKALLSFERIFEVLGTFLSLCSFLTNLIIFHLGLRCHHQDNDVEVKEKEFPKILIKTQVRGEVVWDNVSFSYDTYEQQHSHTYVVLLLR